jgi:hypothetical protein
LFTGSRKNIEEHYDAGNAMYKLFLDDSMMYSSAMHAADDEDLYQVGNPRLFNPLVGSVGYMPAALGMRLDVSRSKQKSSCWQICMAH